MTRLFTRATLLNMKAKKTFLGLKAFHRTYESMTAGFNSRMAGIYRQPSKSVFLLSSASNGNAIARRFISASRSKGLADIHARMTWGVKILYATRHKIDGMACKSAPCAPRKTAQGVLYSPLIYRYTSGLYEKSGFDHSEAMVKEKAHTNKCAKLRITWQATL